MEISYNKGERLHALDALRAIMMLLGIVLHATEPYSLGEDAFWPKDPSARSGFFGYIFSVIHIFRMPIFFLISGFFGSMLFYERGATLMIKNRVSRVVLPFIVFLLLLHPIIISAWTYTEAAFNTKITSTMTTLTWLPEITYHLWFLYYLILITGFSFLLAMLLKRAPSVTKKITRSFEWFMGHRPVFITLFSIIMFIMLLWIYDWWIPTTLSFTPDIKVFLAYSIFYFLGWILFKSKHLLSKMMRNDWLFIIVAFIIFTVKYYLFFELSYISDVLYSALNTVVIWFFIFGFIGLFMRYFSNHSPRMRYISDASYWVYLIHLPVIGFIPGLIVDLPFPAFIKFLIVMVVTTLVCFTTYHYLVRGTFIGKFLNGKKYSTKN
jgi:peptidoglycan/LPS O-acetylase OafA/YrhL